MDSEVNVHRFIAPTAAAAVAQIKAELGPGAVVLGVRKVPAGGWRRALGRQQIEVTAHVPPQEPSVKERPDIAALREEVAQLRQNLPRGLEDGVLPSGLESPQPHSRRAPGYCGWKTGQILEGSGLLPVFARQIITQLQAQLGPTPPSALSRELAAAKGALAGLGRFRRPAPAATGVHFFIGPAGSGKTTCLCKRLAQAVLLEERPARVLRLDGATANTAEMLSVYGEILGVEVERSAAQFVARPGELALVDWPGIDPTDEPARGKFLDLLRSFPNAEVHLVLNAAYETTHLLETARKFQSLPVTDVTLTHLDEELRWGKIWNLCLGTTLPVSWLGAGQNIPGTLVLAGAEKIFEMQFPQLQRLATG